MGGLVFCKFTKNTFCSYHLDYTKQRNHKYAVYKATVINPSGKSNAGDFMPFWGCKRRTIMKIINIGISHIDAGKQQVDGKPAVHQWAIRNKGNVDKLQEQTLWFWNGSGNLAHSDSGYFFAGMIIKSPSWTLPSYGFNRRYYSSWRSCFSPLRQKTAYRHKPVYYSMRQKMDYSDNYSL